MKLSAVRRSPRGNESIRTVAMSQLDEALRDIDHVINILPAAAGNSENVQRPRFAQMKRGAIFYNIGRGDTVDQDALCDALSNGHLAAAYLDVTTPEPLPPEHRLWSAPNCWITPHIAGGHRDELRVNLEHFLGEFPAIRQWSRAEGSNRLTEIMVLDTSHFPPTASRIDLPWIRDRETKYDDGRYN